MSERDYVNSPWLTIGEVCAYTKYGRKTILALIRNDQLRACGMANKRRIHRDHLDAQMKAGFPRLGPTLVPPLERRRRGPRRLV